MRHSVGAELTGASRMDEQGEPTAGQWADDPTGRYHFRWWDGTKWTGHVANGEIPPTRAPSAAPKPGSSRRRRQPREAAAESEAAVEGGTEGDEAPRARRGGPLAGLTEKGFWTGAAVGGGFVALVALLAAVALGGGGDTKTTTTTTKATTTSTEATTTTTGVTTTTLAPGRPVAEVRVSVQNASGVSGAASEKSSALQTLGYTITGAGNLPTREGTIVQCNTGFEADAPHLAIAVGGGATVQAPQTAGTTVPSGADCVVILGTTPTATPT